MKITKSDFELIKRGVIFLAVAILVAGIGYGTTGWFTKKKLQELTTAKSNLSQTRSRYAQSRDEGEELRRDLPVYQSLFDHGFIGEEQRLNWIETISQIRSARTFYDIEYKIEAQQPYTLEPVPELFSVFASPMTIQFDLLHEEDLLNFMEDLKNKAKGVFIVKECEMDRKEETQLDSKTTLAKLKSTCNLSWISLKEKS
jgi:hypothetical protein